MRCHRTEKKPNFLLLAGKAVLYLEPPVHVFPPVMKIKAYLKPSCGWSNGVRAIMQKHNLPYEDIDIINNRMSYAEMVEKSGQPLSP